MTELKVQDVPEEARLDALAYASCFRGPDGERVLKHLGRQTFAVCAQPHEGMTMLETGVFVLGEQALYHKITSMIANGKKVKNA